MLDPWEVCQHSYITRFWKRYMVAKTTYRLAIGATGVGFIKATKNVVKDIVATLGWTEADDVPSGKLLLAEGRSELLEKGCFPLAIYYEKAKKKRRAIVLVAPEKADTAANDLLGKNYNGAPIKKVTAVRRVKYSA